MIDDTLAEILSGRHTPADRADLHAALDVMLDAADGDGGRLDGPTFWGFVAGLARGRGVAEEIANGAAAKLAERSGLPDKLAEAWRAAQWAYLFTLMRHISAFPGEIMPRDFSAAAFIAVADNILSGKKKGEAQDLLALGTQRGAEWAAEARAARRLVVGAVFFQAEKTGEPVSKVRRTIIPKLPDRTWKDWIREVARAKRVQVEDVGAEARAAARLERNPSPYDLDADAVERLMSIGWRSNG